MPGPKKKTDPHITQLREYLKGLDKDALDVISPAQLRDQFTVNKNTAMYYLYWERRHRRG